jgi:hypothetical protein
MVHIRFADVYRYEFNNTLSSYVTWIEETFSQMYLPVFFCFIDPASLLRILHITRYLSYMRRLQENMQSLLYKMETSIVHLEFEEYLLSREIHGAHGFSFERYWILSLSPLLLPPSSPNPIPIRCVTATIDRFVLNTAGNDIVSSYQGRLQCNCISNRYLGRYAGRRSLDLS